MTPRIPFNDGASAVGCSLVVYICMEMSTFRKPNYKYITLYMMCIYKSSITYYKRAIYIFPTSYIHESRPGMRSLVGRRTRAVSTLYTYIIYVYIYIYSKVYIINDINEYCDRGVCARCARGEWSASEIIFGFIRPLNVDN